MNIGKAQMYENYFCSHLPESYRRWHSPKMGINVLLRVDNGHIKCEKLNRTNEQKIQIVRRIAIFSL